MTQHEHRRLETYDGRAEDQYPATKIARTLEHKGIERMAAFARYEAKHQNDDEGLLE
jgi:hypothetical protein